MDQSDDSQTIPTFFTLLEPEDQQKYIEMQKILSNSEKRYKRNKRIESLQEALDKIHDFCIHNDADDWKRCLVCGVCWMGQDIAINTRQLRLLVDKCKSSINGALSKMGYGTAPIKSVITAALLTYIPFLKGNFVEQRQWTVRRKIQFSPIPLRNGMPSPYVLYQPNFISPEPMTPYMMTSDSSSTSPETPQEMEIKSIFGISPQPQNVPTHPTNATMGDISNVNDNNVINNINADNNFTNNNSGTNYNSNNNFNNNYVNNNNISNNNISNNNISNNNISNNNISNNNISNNNISNNNISNNNISNNNISNNNVSNNIISNNNVNNTISNPNIANTNYFNNINHNNIDVNNLNANNNFKNVNPTDNNPNNNSLDENADKFFNDSQYNFLYDPCCCCPVQWAQQDESIEEYFMMG